MVKNDTLAQTRKGHKSSTAVHVRNDFHHRRSQSFNNHYHHHTATTRARPKTVIHVTIRSPESSHPIKNNSIEQNNKLHSTSNILDTHQQSSLIQDLIECSKSETSSISIIKTFRCDLSLPGSSSNTWKSNNRVEKHQPKSSKVAPHEISDTITNDHHSINTDRKAIPYDYHRNAKKKKKKKNKCWQRCIPISLIIAVLLGALIATILILFLNKSKTIHPTAILRWNSTGTTVLGITNSSGSASNQLAYPYGLAWDSSGALIIADYYNHRIQKLVIGISVGITVAGQSSGIPGNSSIELFKPVHAAVDSSDNIFVTDRGNNRLQFWGRGASSGTTILGTAGFPGSSNNQLNQPSGIVRGLSSDTYYIADASNNRVIRYVFNTSSGDVVAGGNATGPNNARLYSPIGLYFDSSSNSLLIANYLGHNIVRWVLGASSWTSIAGSGSNLPGNSSTLLNSPIGVTLDPMGNMYVADVSNHRIQLFLSGQSTGTTIAGITGVRGTNSTLLNQPFWVILDNQLNLYVSDRENHRIQKFTRY